MSDGRFAQLTFEIQLEGEVKVALQGGEREVRAVVESQVELEDESLSLDSTRTDENLQRQEEEMDERKEDKVSQGQSEGLMATTRSDIGVFVCQAVRRKQGLHPSKCALELEVTS